MKIAIDTQTTLGQKSGFGFYTQNLVENLKKVSLENEYILIAPESENDLSTPKRFIWDQFTFPNQAKKAKADILHQPAFSVPVWYKGKKIVTCHDIIPFLFPKNLSLTARLFWAKWMPWTYKKADLIITDAESTKKDLIEYLHLPKEKIRVIPLAVSSEFHPITDSESIEKIKQKYQTSDKYFIHIGTLEPRKNLEFLVKAFAQAVKEGIVENLVIVGKKGWYYDELFNLVNELKLSDRVIFTGYAEDKDIPLLYNGATALVFPSLYEGFGFPPLEAMSCGTPVISSNTSSLPEVVGEAGILLFPDDVGNWAKKMLEISYNKNLAQNLSQKGLEQAKKFSWIETAKKTAQVYRELSK